MDFFVFLIAVSVVVVLPLTILKLLLDYKRERLQAEREARPTGEAVTVGELKEVMREVAAETVAPLEERITSLERGASLTHAPDEPVEEVRERTLGRRTL